MTPPQENTPQSSAPSTETVAHFPALDGLRGIAILLVLVHQFGALENNANIFDYLLKYTIGVGWAGVQLFFVLSGFLITGILLDTQKNDNYYSSFYARRTLRIFPLYYGTLIFGLIVLPMLGFVVYQPTHNHIWLWIYLSNWVDQKQLIDHVYHHFWSLAVEEQFYLLWPLLLHRASPKQCIKLCCSFAAIALVSRCYLVWRGDAQVPTYYWTICRMDALAVGAAFAAMLRVPEYRAWLTARSKPLFFAACAIAAGGLFVTHGYSIYHAGGQAVGFSILALAFGLIVIAAAGADTVRQRGAFQLLRAPLLTSFGKYSYAIYVFHKPLHDAIGKPLIARLGLNVAQSSLANLLYIGCMIAALWVLGWLSYQLIEKHFLKLKVFFGARPHTGAATR